MERAIKVNPAGQWPAREARDSVTLPYDARHRRRLRLTTDGEVAANIFLNQISFLSPHDGLSTIHNGKTVGDVPGEFQVLLDQQDRYVAPSRKILDDQLDLFDNRRLNTLRRLIEDE